MRVACIGSRNLVLEQLQDCREIAKWVASYGAVVSGGAPGADQAFLSGAFMVGGEIEVHLPWMSFEKDFQTRITGRRTTFFPKPTERHLYDASRYFLKDRGRPLSLFSPGIQKLMARNVGIVENCDGVIAFPAPVSSKFSSGGTRFGMFVAREMNLPVLDLSIERNPMNASLTFLRRLAA